MFKVSQASSILAACLMSAGALPAFAQADLQNSAISSDSVQTQPIYELTPGANGDIQSSEIMMRGPGGPGGGGHPGGPGGGGHPGGPGPGRPGPGPGGPGGGWHPGPGPGRPGPGPGGGWHPGPGPGRPGPGPGGGWHPGPGRPGPGGGYWPVPVPGPAGYYQCSAQNGYGQVWYGTAYDTGTAQQVAMNQCYQFSNFNCVPTGCIWR